MGWFNKKPSAGNDDPGRDGRVNPYAQQGGAPGVNPYARQPAGTTAYGGPARADSLKSIDTLRSVDTLPPYSNQTSGPPQYVPYSGPSSASAPSAARYPAPQRQGQGLPAGPRPGGPNANMPNPGPNRYGVSPASGPPSSAPRADSALFGGARQRGGDLANNQVSNYRQPGPLQPNGPPDYNSGLFGGAGQRQPADNRSAPSRPGPYGRSGVDTKGDDLFGGATQRAAPSSSNPSALNNGEPPSAEDEENRQKMELRAEADRLVLDSKARTTRMREKVEGLVSRSGGTDASLHGQQLALIDASIAMHKAGTKIQESKHGVDTLHKLDKSSMFVPVHDSRKKKAMKEEQQFTQFQGESQEVERLMAQKAALIREQEEFEVKMARSGPKLIAQGRSKFNLQDDDDADFVEDDMTEEEKSERLDLKHGTDEDMEHVSLGLSIFNMRMAEVGRKLDKEAQEGWIANAEIKATNNNEAAWRVNQKLKQIGK